MFLDLLHQELGDSKFATHETRFCCPFCQEQKYKFYVHDTKGLWTCFKCGAKGNPVSFVMDYFSVTYPEAVDILATYDYDVSLEGRVQYTPSQYGSDLTEEEQLLLFIAREGKPFDEQEKKVRYTCPAPPTNCKSLVANFDNPEAFPFFSYLHSRGVSLQDIHTHNISYVTYGEVTLEDGRKMSLVNHIVFWTFDENHRPIYWNTRSIEPEPFIKSFNAPSKAGEYSKNNAIFNLNNAVNYDKIVIAEGVFNSLTVGGCSVATFGKQVTDEQMDIILEKTKARKLPIYLFLDTDAWEKMIAYAHKIHSKEPDRLVYYVCTGTDKDANDLGTVVANQYIKNAILADAAGDLQLTLQNKLSKNA